MPNNSNNNKRLIKKNNQRRFFLDITSKFNNQNKASTYSIKSKITTIKDGINKIYKNENKQPPNQKKPIQLGKKPISYAEVVFNDNGQNKVFIYYCDMEKNVEKSKVLDKDFWDERKTQIII